MKIGLGVTGCIGAYKSAAILRELQKAGADVRVVMTDSARQFIGEATLEALSGAPVVTSLFSPGINTPIRHIALAREIDLLLVAPATANILAKFATGICDDALTTVYVSTTRPVVVAPAMNVEMWRHPATAANVALLRERGVYVIEPQAGYLACGEEGEGRLAEPLEIVQTVLELLRPAGLLRGKKILVTAGPTREPIDTVRFISNRSSGKMGYAVAGEAASRGADVVLVSGPTGLPAPPSVLMVSVQTAEEMRRAVADRFAAVDCLIMAAAVADYRSSSPHPHKIKKQAKALRLELETTPDILTELGRRKTGQVVVGFAAETEDLRENALAKLRTKNLDLIAVNDISRSDIGFDSDFNELTLVFADGRISRVERASKQIIARALLDKVEELLNRSVVPSPLSVAGD